MDLNNYKNFIELSFGSSKIKYNDMLTKQASSTKPNIKFTKDPSKLYTIITIDPDAPSASNPIYKYFLHMLIVNNSDIIMEWTGPDPPTGSNTHRYYTCVFEQVSPIDINKISIKSRPKFDLNTFVKSNNLVIKGCFKFRVEG
jgi:phosphatidylethanolamine-binding protein (PEBP) family uncharacterized protein